MPTFLWTFRRHPRLRVFFATSWQPASLPGMLWSGLCVWGFIITCLQVFADE